MTIAVCSLLYHLYDYIYYSRTHLPYYAVMVMQAVGVPIGIIIVPLGFLCSFYYQHFHRTCCTRATQRQYEKLDTGKAMCPASERISQPSNSFFSRYSLYEWIHISDGVMILHMCKL